jgi:hypothetical protein
LYSGGWKKDTAGLGGSKPEGRGRSTEELFDVVAPDESDEDVGEQVGCFVEVLAGNVAVGESAHEREGLEGEHGDHLAAKVGADDVDDRDHEYAYDDVALEGGEGHLLA